MPAYLISSKFIFEIQWKTPDFKHSYKLCYLFNHNFQGFFYSNSNLTDIVLVSST